MSIQMSRRSAVALGLGLLAAAPASALAQTITKTGTSEAGEALEGLVTVHGRSYLYVGGELYKGGRREYRGKERYFHPEDGHMAVDEDVTWDDGTQHHYDAEGVLHDKRATQVVDESMLPAGWYNLALPGGAFRLDVEGARTSEDAKVYLQAPDDGRGIEQKFRITWPDPYRVRIESPMGVLRVRDASKEEGAPVTQCAEAGIEAERWSVERDEDGNYLFRNAVNGGLMGVAEAAGCSEAKCLEDTEADTQRWVLSPCAGFTGWWTDIDGALHCTDPASALMIRDAKRVDPYLDDYGAIYDFDHAGVPSWHLPTYDDVPDGHGEGAPIPSPQGDRRQRALILAISRIGCPYALGEIPNKFVCDGLSGWCYETATGDHSYSGDASYQWASIKDRNGIKYNMSDLKSGDLVFFGGDSLTWGAGQCNYDVLYHAGVYYADGQMINARGDGGVQLTDVNWYATSFMPPFLGGGSPYQAETSRCPIHS